MKSWKVGAAMALGLVSAAIPVGASAQANPEFRGAWVSRFEWATVGASPATMRARIDTIMSTLRQHNFNAVLFQIRGQCDVLYPSPYEPWGRPFGWQNPGWDPLAYAIQSARANNLEFHAYINTHTMAQDIPPAVTTPQHLYNVHGPTSSDPWVIHNTQGVPQNIVDAYAWISPGIPAAESWTRRAVMHVVDNYDVDGIHYDRIRTPGAGFSYDPATVARFNGAGNPNGLDWGDFMRSQITEQLRRLQGAIALTKPHIKTSAAPFGICRREPGGYQGTGTQSYFVWYQDSFGWMEQHVLDCLFPQIYWDIGSAHPFEVLLADFMRHDGGRHIYPGSVTSRDYIAQVYEARRQGALGTTVFSFNSMDFAAYSLGPYQQSAPIPEMPWKTNPTTAVIAGDVLAPDGTPVIDAHVRIGGNSWVFTSGGDGFYAILDVAPGTHTVTATHGDFGTASGTLAVAAGDAIRLDLKFTDSRGRLRFSPDVATLGEAVELTLTDGDLMDEEYVSVRVFTPREPDGEWIELPASGEGVFVGNLPLLAAPPVSADGFVAYGPGMPVNAVYLDAFGGDGPTEITASMTIAPMLIDNDTPGFTFEGPWLTSSFGNNFGANKRYIANNNPQAAASWTFPPAGEGRFAIEFWVNDNNYAKDARYTISEVGANGSGIVLIGDQNSVGDGWQALGEFSVRAGGPIEARLVGQWSGPGIYAVADAMRVLFAGEVESDPPAYDGSLWMIH